MDGSFNRILIVEDHQESARSLAHFCRAVATQVEIAASAREAMERLAEAHYDCIIMDCRLPDGNGLELARWIRAASDRRNRELVIVGVSADLRYTHVRCLEAGMNAVVHKPVAPQVLVKLITSLV